MFSYQVGALSYQGLGQWRTFSHSLRLLSCLSLRPLLSGRHKRDLRSAHRVYAGWITMSGGKEEQTCACFVAFYVSQFHRLSSFHWSISTSDTTWTVGSSLYLIHTSVWASLHLCIFSHATPPFVQDVAPCLYAGTDHKVDFWVSTFIPSVWLSSLITIFK